MTRHQPLAVRAQTAAAMLDMPPAEDVSFTRLGAAKASHSGRGDLVNATPGNRDKTLRRALPPSQRL
jgi:hypothetical protein